MDEFLREQYIAALQDRLKEIKLLITQHRAGDTANEQGIRTFAHSLHGSGSSFGYPAISELAKTVELAPAAELIKTLTPLVKEIRRVVLDATPALAQNPAAVAPDPVPDSSPALRNVLIIDDDLNCIALTREVLLAMDPQLQIVTANTAREAEALLVHSAFTIIVLDLMLPDRDGREILREIKVDFKLPTPVLVLSGITKDLVRVECMSIGADKFLNKPIASEVLSIELKKLLQQANKPALTLVPKDNELGKANKTAPVAKPAMLNKTVLVAEDDPMQAKLIQQHLAKEGFQVEVATNGRHALQQLRQQRYSLVILDVQMPMVSGFDVLEKMRGELEMKDIPVIILSAMGSERDIIRGYDLGANDYILKPFSPIQLVARVKTLVKKKAP